MSDFKKTIKVLSLTIAVFLVLAALSKASYAAGFKMKSLESLPKGAVLVDKKRSASLLAFKVTGDGSLSSVDQFGVIDRNGKVVLGAKFHDIADIKSDLIVAGVRKDPMDVNSIKYALYDKTGKQLTKSIFSKASKINVKLKDSVSKTLIRAFDQNALKPEDFEFYGVLESPEFYSAVGVYDYNGKEILAPKYRKVVPGLGDVFLVTDDKGKMGMFDKTGKQILPFEYDKIGTGRHGVYAAVKGERAGYVDKTGAVKLAYEYDFVAGSKLFDNLDSILYVGKNDKIALLNDEFKVITDYIYDSIDEVDGSIVAKRGEHVMLLSKDGKEGEKIKAEGIKAVNESGYIISSSGGYHEPKLGLAHIDKGEILPPAYDDISFVGKDKFIIQKQNLSGLIDSNQKYLIPLKERAYMYAAQDFIFRDEKGTLIISDLDGNQILSKPLKNIIVHMDNIIVSARESGNGLDLLDKDANVIHNHFAEKAEAFLGHVALLKGDDEVAGLLFTNGAIAYFPQYKSLSVFNLGSFDELPEVNMQVDIIGENYDGSLDYLEGGKDLPAGSTNVSIWAVEEVAAAAKAGIIPKDLFSDYRSNINRLDFCRLAVNVIGAKKNLSLDAMLKEFSAKSTFTDTDDPSVNIAAKLKIVNGKGNGKFDPSGEITREEAAKMLSLTAEYLGAELSDEQKSQPQAFANDAISEWAKPYVDRANKLGLMKGVSENKFDAKGTYTREQAFITMKRTLEK